MDWLTIIFCINTLWMSLIKALIKLGSVILSCSTLFNKFVDDFKRKAKT